MDANETLIGHAKKAMANAKAVYSGFKVGAALQCKDGKIFTGCNVESSSYGLTICAERCAVFKALSEGYEKGDFIALAVVTEKSGPISPCGACRQVLWDWAPELEIICKGKGDDMLIRNIKQLLPEPFDSDNLK
jgi:cytidine deaminase